MENTNLPLVQQTDSLLAIDKAQIDVQIATAHQYPRNLQNCISNIETLACSNPETAGACSYVLRRTDVSGKTVRIEGPSVRMAEIVAQCWGNLRVMTSIIGDDGKTITARAVCHDLENNVAIASEVQRRITGKSGKTFSDDMKIVTGNAAASIALRNAIFKVVPLAYIKPVMDKAKQVAEGAVMDVETSRQNCLAYFNRIGVNEKMILDYFGLDSVMDLGVEEINDLRGLKNAISEGSTSVEETFIKPANDKKIAEAAKAKADEAKKKAEDAAKIAVAKPVESQSRIDDMPVLDMK